MKRKFLFLLFVIGLIILPSTMLHGQIKNVEEHSTVIEQKTIDDKIRFTLSVERDSSLCLPSDPIDECYVNSKSIKKYVFVNIAETPRIAPSYARKAFEKIGYWIDIDTTSANGGNASRPVDFEPIDPVYTYSQFPWLMIKCQSVDKRYYACVRSGNSLKMIKKVESSPLTVPALHIFALWILLFVIIFIAVRSYYLGNFAKKFEELETIPISTCLILAIIVIWWQMHYNNSWPLYPIYYGLAGIALHLIQEKYVYYEINFLPLEEGMEEKISYKSVFYFLYSIGAILALIFWMVNKNTIYNWTLITVPVIISALVLFGLIVCHYDLIKTKINLLIRK